jgi:type II secretory pathway pseudopilin PulG
MLLYIEKNTLKKLKGNTVMAGEYSSMITRSSNLYGFGLVESMLGLALIAVLVLTVLSANVPAVGWTRQADKELRVSRFAFAVLEAVRANAEGIDFEKPVSLAQLPLENPDNIPASVETEKEAGLGRVYLVRVQAGDGVKWPCTTLLTLVRGSG